MVIQQSLCKFLLILVPATLVTAAAVTFLGERRQQEQSHALISAIHDGNSSRALALIRAGADPNALDYEPSPTLLGLLTGMWDRMRGITVARAPWIHSATFLAAKANCTDVAEALLAHGARPGPEQDDTGDTMIAVALRQEHDRLVRLLWQSGAADKDDLARLVTWAAEKNDSGAVIALSMQGAPMNGPSDGENSPFFVAARARNWPMMRLLLARGASVNGGGLELDSGDDISALCLAAHRSDFQMVSFLLAHGADVNASGRYASALWRAAEQNNVKMFRLLLAHHADPNAYGDAAPLICMLTARHDGYECNGISRCRQLRRQLLKMLLRAGANPNTDEKGGPTLINELVADGDKDMIEQAIRSGADINYSDDADGSTALMTAAELGNVRIARFLLTHGAKVNMLRHVHLRGKVTRSTALDDAVLSGHRAVARLLRQWGGHRALELARDER